MAWLAASSERLSGLLLVGAALGVTLTHGAFGFASAYRALFVRRDASGVLAQLLMLALATALFAPTLSGGVAFGHDVVGATAPAGVSVAVGAFLFAIGMQLGSACASGCLYVAGSGDLRALVVIAFFCAGAFLGSLHLDWWLRLPSSGETSFGQLIGWKAAALVQISLIGVLALALGRFASSTRRVPVTPRGSAWLKGPWPAPFAAAMLATLNWSTLLIAGHPWSITWAFALWGAKAALLAGWTPPADGFWSGEFQLAALKNGVLADETSVMNIGILLGAFIAAAAAGRLKRPSRISLTSLAAAALGGLLMGYGARLSFGCNIGSFFSGVASTSLHGWEWIGFALLGTPIGVALRRRFGLPD
ncbi:YeeE/YedE family protein [Bradyrhizobium sp.]|uniref:YeeE/YedE family protein n=1 Tax=Bradyrhizobium sp. TaxID=376 RepID=UPI004037B2C6